MDPASGDITVRRARVGDEAAMVRLRALMFVELGWDDGDPDASWRVSAHAWFTRQLEHHQTFAAFVADDAELGVISMAAGIVHLRPPGPRDPVGMTGHVVNVSTDGRRRRQGLARACTSALLTWFSTETEAAVVDLNASGDGAELYRELGFVDPSHPVVQLRLGPLRTRRAWVSRG